MSFCVMRWEAADEYCTSECIYTMSPGLKQYHAGGHRGAFREPKNKVKRLRLLISIALDRRQCRRWIDCCKPVVSKPPYPALGLSVQKRSRQDPRSQVLNCGSFVMIIAEEWPFERTFQSRKALGLRLAIDTMEVNELPVLCKLVLQWR